MIKQLLKRIVKWLLIAFFGLNIILIVLSFFINVNADDVNTVDESSFSSVNLLTFDDSRNYQTIDITTASSDSLTDNWYQDITSDIYNEYGSTVYEWVAATNLTFNVNINKSGKYMLAVDFKSLQTDVQDISINVLIDGIDIEDYQNIILPTYWTDAFNTESIYDIYGNEVNPTQEIYRLWSTYYLYDQRFYNNTPLIFELTNGLHEITISKNNGSFLLGNLYLIEYDQYDNYESPQNIKTNDQLIILEGENPLYKSSSSISATSTQMVHLTPFSTSNNVLNNLNGDTFNTSGDSVTYAFNIEEDGYYNIAVKYYISQTNTNVYSKIIIDNEVLYDELNTYCFKNLLNNKKTSYRNEVLNVDGEDILFYFTKGTHYLTFQLDASLQSSIYDELNSLVDEINELYLEVIKLTGGINDKNHNWNIEKYIPTASTRLNDWCERLEKLLDYINTYSKSNAKKQNALYQNVKNAYDKLKKIAANPNKLPNKLNTLVDGSASVSLLLSNSLHTSTFSPLSIDKIYIYGNATEAPKVQGNFFKSYFSTVQRIFRTKVSHADSDTVTIWVNRSTYYVSLMQKFADAYFTPETGIKVRLSLLPDESKLTYANASSTQPDAAMGVSSSVPYDLGIRGALVDLSTFANFDDVISCYASGSLVSLAEGDALYGIPETQDFYVCYYREDILDSLGIDVPQTYDDIIEIVPTLQRYGMNYYMPLAGGSGLKSISITAPFIYQYGGSLYTDDYLSANIDSKEAIQAFNTMVDLFALYSLPLTTQNFYNNFRSGLNPIGIAGFDTYLQLTNAALEITGKWHITLCPGVKNSETGEINRTQTGDTKNLIIFKKSTKQQEAWKFLTWWMSEDIQTKFASDLQATYGSTFLWNSANLKAFANLAIAEEDKKVILEQLEYLYNVPQTPATYMVERGISNIWNACVFEQASLRAEITNYSLEINREIKRKMTEFKYLDEDGNVLKKYYNSFDKR